MKVTEAVKVLTKISGKEFEELENVLIGLLERSKLNCSYNSSLVVKISKCRISILGLKNMPS